MSKRTTSRPDSAPFYSEPTGQPTGQARVDRPANGKAPNKPDWLLIFVSALFLISLLIVWLVDVPSLLRW